MTATDLDAAAVIEPRLRASYETCRRLNAAHGRTYYLATRLLPPEKRPAVHALYGFARYADEIVDDLASTQTPAQRAAELEDWGGRFLADLRGGGAGDAVTAAVLDTAHRYAIPAEHFEAFLASMRMDLTVESYATYDDLLGYVYGSAAVIGLMVMPVLGATDPAAAPYARDLGIAFQLSNFIRDVGEDLRRGRIYLPLEDLALFGVDRAHLERGVVDGPVRRLLAHEIARTREIYAAAAPGVRLLDATSRPCVEAALRLYGGILDEVERARYQVLDRRVSVPPRRRAAVALPLLVRAVRARRG
ncbi:MAG: phytoene synthase [Mycobacterium sp.]|jgi:phytoene synthase|nr:phytoene synthase [Mycobacterium sp.]MCW2744714.1 phytoene synthase [Mycobacterium sp.]